MLLHIPGNATDLSLLTSLTHEDIQALQSVERGKEFVLKNDFAKSWAHIRTLKDARLDIVLDNVSVVCKSSQESADAGGFSLASSSSAISCLLTGS